MKILVTGASGFIGKQALFHLVKNGHAIHAVSSSQPVRYEDGVSWHCCNLFDAQATRKLLQSIRPSHLLHLAWEATPGKFWTSLDNLGWVKASIDLLESFYLEGGKRIVVAGTCAEYDWSSGICSESRLLFKPSTLYGACKRGFYQIAEAFSRQTGISFAWGYVFHLFGYHENPSRFVPVLIRGLLQNQEVPCSHGRQIRDFLDVRDAASAFASLIESDVQGGINIGSGNGVSLKEMGRLIESLIGTPDLLRFGALSAPEGDPEQLIPDVKRLYSELNWRPKYTLAEGLKETVSWWKKTV